MTVELVDIYAGARRRIIAMVTETGETQAEQPVPGTPGWTVRDLMCHLSGVTEDLTSGNLEGAPGDQWTANQIARRKGRTVADLVDDWTALGAKVDGMIPDMGRSAVPLAFDALVHEHDLRGALGRPGPGDEQAVDYVVQQGVVALGRRLSKAGAPALRILAGDTEWVVGDGEPEATVTTTGFELFRALFGRRSEAQVRAWDWEGDPGPYLPAFNIFNEGQLPAVDVAEASAG